MHRPALSLSALPVAALPLAALLLAGLLTAGCQAKVDLGNTKSSAPTHAEASGATGGDWSDGSKPAGPTARGEAPGTSVAISADRASGEVKLAIPGARFEFDLPDQMFRASEFDIDGAKLYPGSVIDTFDVRGKAGDGEDVVRIAFTAPAAPDVVRGWMLTQKASSQHPLRAAREALVGTTADGKTYTVRLAPGQTPAQTKGVILVVG